MDGNQIRVSNRKRIVVYPIAFAVLVFWAISCGKGTTTKAPYSVSVSIDSSGFHYHVPPPSGACKNNTSTTPDPTKGDILLCKGESIEWTSEPASYEISVVVADGILGTDTSMFAGKGKTSVGTVSQDAGEAAHMYWVTVIDDNKRVHRDPDPVIIIGGGT